MTAWQFLIGRDVLWPQWRLGSDQLPLFQCVRVLSFNRQGRFHSAIGRIAGVTPAAHCSDL